MEKERRGVYAGAVGRFDFADDEMDTCIAIRTMVFKDGISYLQAGGGIVFDSVEEDEYMETINKLEGNVRALKQAEGTKYYIRSAFKLADPALSTEHWYEIQQYQSRSRVE